MSAPSSIVADPHDQLHQDVAALRIDPHPVAPHNIVAYANGPAAAAALLQQEVRRCEDNFRIAVERCFTSSPDHRSFAEYQVEEAKVQLQKAKIAVCNAEVEAARAAHRRDHPDHNDAAVKASVGVSSKLRELREAEVMMRNAQLDACYIYIRIRNTTISDAAVKVSPDVADFRTKLSEAKVEMCKAKVEAIRAVYRHDHPDDGEAVVNASDPVSSARRELWEAQGERDMLPTTLKFEKCEVELEAARAAHRLKHPTDGKVVTDASDEVYPKLEEFHKARVEKCKAEVEAAIAVYRRAHPDDGDAVVNASYPVSSARRELCEAQRERDMLPTTLKFEKCEVELEAARAAYRLKHPADGKAVTDASDEVYPKLEEFHEAKVEMCMAALEEARAAHRLKHPTDGKAVTDASDEVYPKLEKFHKAKIEMCEAAVEAARAAYRRDHPDHGNAVTNASDPVLWARRELWEAQREMDKLPTTLKFEKCKAAVEKARAAYHCKHPNDVDADVDLSAEVYLKLEEFHKAKIEMCEAAVEAARAVYRNSHPHIAPDYIDMSEDVFTSLVELGRAQTDMDMLPGTLKVAKCNAEVQAARVAERLKVSKDAYVDVDASATVSLKLLELKKAERDRDMLPTKCKIDRIKISLDAAKLKWTQKGVAKELVEVCEDVMGRRSHLVAAEAEHAHKDAVLTVKELQSRAATAKIRLDVFKLPGDKVIYDQIVADLEKAETVASQRAQSVKEASAYSFLHDHLPYPLQLENTFFKESSQPNRDNGFDTQFFQQRRFSALTHCDLNWFPSKTWGKFLDNRVVAAETGVAVYVHSGIEDACRACGMKYAVNFAVRLEDGIPNLCISSRGDGKILSVVEVKLKDAFCEATWYKIHRYLLSLRAIHGISYPIAILSNYNEWQFCWLEYASPVAEATTLEQIASLPSDPPSTGKIGLCVSKVYKCNDPGFNTILASFLMKLSSIPRGAKQDVWYTYTSDSVVPSWKALEPAALKLHQMPRDNAATFTTVRFLGAGTDGSVFLMRTASNACCVAKFSSTTQGNKEGPMVRERDAWRAAYGDKIKVRVTKLNHKHVLLMPYHDDLTEDDWKDSETQKLVMEHIRWLDSRGVRHRDIERRHVVWVQPSQLSDVELDFVRLKLIEEGNDAATLTPADLRARAGRNVRLIDWGEAGNIAKVLQNNTLSGLSREDYLSYARRCLGPTDEDEERDDV